MKTSKFKMTELGPIPEDWEVKPFSECFTLIRNNTYARECLTDHPGSVANVHYGDVLIKYGAVLDFAKNAVPYLKSDVKPNKDMLRDGDLVFADTAEDEAVGKAVEVQGLKSRMAVAGLHTVASRPHDGLFAPRYLGYYINSAAYHNQLLTLITGTKVSSVSRAGFLSTYVAIPPKGEQERIAETLSDVDALLSAMATLIEKKRAIKQGAMQELLGMRNVECGMRNVPRRRLAGFSGAWIEKRLGDVCEINPRMEGEIPERFIYVDLESVVGGILTAKKILLRTEAPSRAQRRFKCGDILFQTVRPYQRNNLLVDFDAEDYVASTGYAIIRGIELCSRSEFIYHLVHMDGFVNDVIDRCTGTSYPAINPRRLAEIMIHIPEEVAEQQAIAGVLSDMDAEIAALEADRAKYESIKQGMMQELLTGKTRLV